MVLVSKIDYFFKFMKTFPIPCFWQSVVGLTFCLHWDNYRCALNTIIQLCNVLSHLHIFMGTCLYFVMVSCPDDEIKNGSVGLILIHGSKRAFELLPFVQYSFICYFCGMQCKNICYLIHLPSNKHNDHCFQWLATSHQPFISMHAFPISAVWRRVIIFLNYSNFPSDLTNVGQPNSHIL